MPKYVVNAGKYELTTEVRSALYQNVRSYQTVLKKAAEYVQYGSFHETKNQLLVSYKHGMEKDKALLHYAYYDKNTKKLLYFSSNKGIPNDYDGGLEFWPMFQTGNLLYAFYDASLFKEHKKKIPAKGSKEAVQSFDTLCKQVETEDNPILVIVKLK
jgi:hypothetical protein